MAKKPVVKIYWEWVVKEVVVPESVVWQFIDQFGRQFAVTDTVTGGTTIRAVDGYFNHPNGWHVRCRVTRGNEEDKFKRFLAEFCRQHQLQFVPPARRP